MKAIEIKEHSHDEIRQTVKAFLVKKYKEKGENIYGTYHNGSSLSSPTRQVDICIGYMDSYAVTYYGGELMWLFSFTKKEINDECIIS